MKTDTDLQHECPQSRSGIEDDKEPPPPAKYARAKLTSATEVGKELARLYREARSGRIDVADASRLANMLSILARILSDSELEARIDALEQCGGFH